MSRSLTLKSQVANGMESVVCGGIYLGIEKGFYKQDIDMELGKRAVIVGGCHYGAQLSQDIVHDAILKNNMSSDLVKKSLVPVLTGGVYVAANKLVPFDYTKGPMMQFFEAVGSAVGASYVSDPLSKAIGLSA